MLNCDRSFLNGQDTESSLAVLALCIATGVSLATLLFLIFAHLVAQGQVARDRQSSCVSVWSALAFGLATSPPLNLRI